MKKLLAILLSIGVILSFSACTKENKKLTENDEGLKQISQKYDKEYQTTANIEYNGTKIKVNMENRGWIYKGKLFGTCNVKGYDL